MNSRRVSVGKSSIILIRGSLGVGKSTIAKLLARELDAVYVPIDLVLEKHGLDRIPKGARCIPLKNFLKADEIVFPNVRKMLAKGKIVVFDACFYHKKHIRHIKKKISCLVFVFTLHAPLEVCIRRDAARKRSHGKAAAAAVYRLVSRFDAGKVIETGRRTEVETMRQIISSLPRGLRQ